MLSQFINDQITKGFNASNVTMKYFIWLILQPFASHYCPQCREDGKVVSTQLPGTKSVSFLTLCASMLFPAAKNRRKKQNYLASLTFFGKIFPIQSKASLLYLDFVHFSSTILVAKFRLQAAICHHFTTSVRQDGLQADMTKQSGMPGISNISFAKKYLSVKNHSFTKEFKRNEN